MAKSKHSFACPVCSKTFAASAIKRHLETRHKDEFSALCTEFASFKFERACACGAALKPKIDWFNDMFLARLEGREDIFYHFPKFCGAKCRNNHKQAWNKGLTKDTSEAMMKISIGRRGDNNPIHNVINDPDKYENWRSSLSQSLKGLQTGITLDEKMGSSEAAILTREKMSNSAKGRLVHGHTGHKHSDETKATIREKTSLAIATSRNKMSKVQLRLYDALRSRFGDAVRLEHHFHFYTIDIAYKNFAIEVDGDFWHVNELKGYVAKYPTQFRNLANDKNKDIYLTNNGWQVLRFWESDINDDVTEVVRKIEDATKN